MSDQKSDQVKDDAKAKKGRRDAGEPATVEEFQNGDETNLPDNPAYVAPSAVDNNM